MLTSDDILIGNIVREKKLVREEILNACKAVLEGGEGGSLIRLLAEKGHVGPAGIAKILEAQRMNPESRRLNTSKMVEDFVFARVAVAAGKISREDANTLLIEQNELVLAGKTRRMAEIAAENLLLNPADMPELLAKTRRAFVLCGECLVPLDATAFPPGAKIQCPTCRSGITIPSKISVSADDFGDTLSEKMPGELPLTLPAGEVKLESIADALAEASAAAADLPAGKAEDKATAGAGIKPPLADAAAGSAASALAKKGAPGAPRRGRPKTAIIKPRPEMLAKVAEAPPVPKKLERKSPTKSPSTMMQKVASVPERAKPSTRPAVRKPARAPITVKKPSWRLTIIVAVIAVIAGIVFTLYVFSPGKDGASANGSGIKRISVKSGVEASTLVVNGEKRGGLPVTADLGKGGSRIGVEAKGYIPASVTVNVEKDTLKLDFSLQPKRAVGVRPKEGTIRVITQPPGASLAIDGKSAQSNWEQKTTVGAHEVLVFATGYKTCRQSVDVGSGEKVVLYVALAPEPRKEPAPEIPAALAFTTNPPGAVVELRIPGADVERYTTPFMRTGLETDTYLVNLHAPGCFDRQIKVDVKSGGTMEVRVSLSRRLLWSVPVGAGAFAPTVVDWDGDGSLEIVSAAAEGRAAVLAGVDGYAMVTVSTEPVTSPAVAGDINGDGKAELVVATYGDADDALAAYDRGGKQLWQVPAGGTVSGVPVLCDLNGDAALEVIFASWGGVVGVVSGSNGSMVSAVKLDSGVGLAPAVIAGELPSVYVADVRGIVRRYDWAYGRLQKVWERSLAPSGVMPVGIIPADVNGDRHPDIIIATNHGLVAAIDAMSGEAFWQADAGGRITHGPAVGDVRGDGGVEVVVVLEGGRVVVLSGSKGKFRAAESPVKGRVVGLAVANISGGGKSDVLLCVAGHASGSGVAVVKVEGGFDSRLFPTPVEPVGVPAVADFNCDGVADIAVPLADGSVSLVSVSPGAAAWRSEFGAPAGPARMRTINKRLEIGLLAQAGGLVWFDAGSGIPASIQTDVPGGPWTAADLNEDDVADVVVSVGDFVKAFDGKSGECLWEHPVDGEDVTAGPPACVKTKEGVLVVFGESGGVLRALSGGSGEEKWKLTGTTAHIAEPVAANVLGDSSPEIVCVTREHGLVCINPAAGNVIWKTRLPGNPIGPPSVFRYGLDLIMVAFATREKLYIVKGGKGEVFRSIYETEIVTSPPTLFDLSGKGTPGLLYTTAAGRLVARKSSGGKAWSRPVRGFSRAPVLAADFGGKKTVLSLGARGRLDAFSATGKPKWKYGRRAASAYVNPVMAVLAGELEGIVLVTDRGIELIGPKISTNPVRWSHDAPQVWK